MSQEGDLRTKLAELVTEHTGLVCKAYQPVISLFADFAAIGLNPDVGYAYVHIPTGQGKSHDLRMNVEVHVLRSGVLNGSGYGDTAEWAESFAAYITESQNTIEGFSDPASFHGSRASVTIGTKKMWESVISFTVVTSA